MRIDIVSIFPAYLEPLRLSLVGKAIETGIVDLGVHDLRDWTHDRHRTVDDTPYGGGAGMVMRPEPWGEALDELATSRRTRLIVLTPSGRTFNQTTRVRAGGRRSSDLRLRPLRGHRCPGRASTPPAGCGSTS